MVKFGFSAFLKLLSLRDKRRTTEMRKRLEPSSGGGYDFHKRFRRLASRYLADEAALADVAEAATAISPLPERVSAVAALETLASWRTATPGTIVHLPNAVFESPFHLFRVRFDTDFGIQRYGQTTALHLWNTKSVALDSAAVYAALALMLPAFATHDKKPDDIGVLSIQGSPRLYLLSEAPSKTTTEADALVEWIEEIIRGPGSSILPSEDRPSP